uniref:Uncharacterized protein n=1 Tax=Rhizophora mucronata TaxID=61149 RepID=A0A2P2QGN3_RHIMU
MAGKVGAISCLTGCFWHFCILCYHSIWKHFLDVNLST